MHTTRLKLRDISRAAAIVIALAAGVPGQAWAQSNATSTIFGEVSAPAGATVVLENLATGVQRTLTPDTAGRYVANSMPPGRYAVRVLRAGSVEATQEVEALIGAGAEANFGPASAAGAVGQEQTVVVKASRNPIDVSNTNNGVIFTAKELKALPVGNDVASIVQLTPGVARGTNSVYGNAPSIGGSGQSENAFYVNGFPITNILTQVGASELPFGAISNMQVLSGGYGFWPLHGRRDQHHHQERRQQGRIRRQGLHHPAFAEGHNGKPVLPEHGRQSGHGWHLEVLESR